MTDKTIKFSIKDENEVEMKKNLLAVYEALNEKGYNSISQIVGYILSEDPTYITTHNNARSLVRSGKTIYYGFMTDPYVVIMQITSTREVKGVEVADRVVVQLVNTDPDVRMKDKIVKKAERRGLYNAMDIGCIWLERELKEPA